MKSNKTPVQRIAVDVPSSLYKSIKKDALEQDKSIKQWVIEALQTKLPKDEHGC